MFKLDLEKAEEPEIKLSTFFGSSKKHKSSRETSICFTDYTKAFDYVDPNKLWKILQEMGKPEHLSCLLINLYAGQEARVRTEHGTTDWFQSGKGVCQCCLLSPAYLTYMQSTSCEMMGLNSNKYIGMKWREELRRFGFSYLIASVLFKLKCA